MRIIAAPAPGANHERILRIALLALWLGLCLLRLTPGAAYSLAIRTQQAQRPAATAPSPRAEHNLRVFNAVWRAVNTRYFDASFNGIDWSQMRDTYRPQAAAATDEQALYRALNLMLAVLRDRHTFAVPPAEITAARQHRSLSVGFVARLVENRVVITQVRNGSSAQAAGIQPGWILTRVGDTPVDASFAGFAIGDGETMRLQFLDAQEREREVRITARPFTDAPEQSARLLDGGALYIRWESFYISGVGRWLARTLAEHRQTRACIIDLRGNWGGLASELQETLEPFFARPAVFGEFIERGGGERRLRVSGKGRAAFGGKVVVLIDGESFSAAELFAAALQESGRGFLVGRRSSGNALNSVEQSLPDGGRLHLSVRDYRTARGLRIEGRGVQPDHTVALTLDDIRRGLDRDLERALRLVE